jgi:hypothetical protein
MTRRARAFTTANAGERDGSVEGEEAMPGEMSRWPRRATLTPAILAACLSLAECIGPQDLNRPLSPLVVRDELVGRRIVASENGQPVTIRLAGNGLSARDGSGPEYGRWRIDEDGALCLGWRAQPERCAPVYAAGGSHYRWGDTELSVLGR